MNIKAFARAGSEFDSSGDWVPAGRQDGMTLRDYFAAKAMQAIITNHKLEDCDDFVIAENAYQLADFMLKAR
jgi:hypothetical protein